MRMHDHISIAADKCNKKGLPNTRLKLGIHTVIFCKPGLQESPPGNLTYQKPVLS